MEMYSKGIFSRLPLFVCLVIMINSLGFSMKINCRGIQLTSEPRNHHLDNNDVFSPDGKWIVYDTRDPRDVPVSEIGANSKIEKINIETGQIIILYETPVFQTEYGPGVGAASFHPFEDKVVVMHGLMNCNKSRPYWFWRRSGVLLHANQSDSVQYIDARDVTAPFTPGALRGGTHRHEWSGDGKWVGFTYNDAIMAEIERKTGQQVNLRTIGVSTGIKSVKVDKDAEGENNDGIWFSALVVKVTPNPKPGSDEISKAYSDAWIGTKGYRKADGTLQRARAFLGDICTVKGDRLTELFVVDIPERIDVSGDGGPLQGTDTAMPMPPKGCTQRRITYTENRKYPGVVDSPRHWVRSSPDGNRISYLAKDDKGIVQVFFASLLSGLTEQVTRHDSSIQSTVRWSSDGEKICYVCDNSIFVCDLLAKTTKRITQETKDVPFSPVWSPDDMVIVFNRWVPNGRNSYAQIFLIKTSSK
jgi:Protein of unknown function (DUF3748)/Dipeptidyl peptidase IV (DPP IV) N-terminal region